MLGLPLSLQTNGLILVLRDEEVCHLPVFVTEQQNEL